MLYTICRRIPPLHDWYFEHWYNSPMYKVCSNVSAYVINRWIDKAHLVQLPQVKKGSWMETDEMMFHAVFQLLVNFVEGQAAYLVKISEDPKNEVFLAWKRAGRNPFKRWWLRNYWNELFGISYLKHYIEDTREPELAEIALKTLHLYDWYKHERPNRPELWNTFKGKKYIGTEEAPNGLTPEFIQHLEQCQSKQDFYYADDTRKAQHVLDIRGSLWT